MATQTESPAAALPSAQVVGNAFVELYYFTLHKDPELAYRFYRDASILSRPDSRGIMISVTTLKVIHETIMSLDYKNCKAEIDTADAEESYQGGVIVLVTGSLIGLDNVKRKFSQTFFLAPQENGYFVQSDIFRFVKEIESLEKNKDFACASVAPLTKDTENHALDSTAIEAEDLQNSPEVYDPSDNEDSSGLEFPDWIIVMEEVVDESPSHSSMNGTSVVVLSDPSTAQEEKKSHTSISRGL